MKNFKFESPAFEKAKEQVRKEYNRITVKSTIKPDVIKDNDGNFLIATRKLDPQGLIKKYKTIHTDLMKEFESNNLVNVWEMEMLRTKLEMVTTFLKDLRSDRHV